MARLGDRPEFIRPAHRSRRLAGRPLSPGVGRLRGDGRRGKTPTLSRSRQLGTAPRGTTSGAPRSRRMGGSRGGRLRIDPPTPPPLRRSARAACNRPPLPTAIGAGVSRRAIARCPELPISRWTAVERVRRVGEGRRATGASLHGGRSIGRAPSLAPRLARLRGGSTRRAAAPGQAGAATSPGCRSAAPSSRRPSRVR